ncbi:MAG: hypothetical protein OXQ90_08815, partial [Gammaproteobacteria bacterium]|nr:hypothetical protein [Gammaproteobacteria bacterium]
MPVGVSRVFRRHPERLPDIGASGGGAVRDAQDQALPLRSARRCRLKPAFQAVGVTSVLELRAEAGVILSGWGWDMRSAERCACRSG